MKEAKPDKTMPVTLRPVTPEDEGFLYSVYASTRVDEFAQVPWSAEQLEAFLRMQFNSKQRSYEIQYEGADHYIILYEGNQVGSLMLIRNAQDILFIDIAVLPQYQNLGIGTSIFKEVCAEAASKGLPVRLHVLQSNTRAARLYQRLGFSMMGEVGTYFLMEWRPDGP
jgi:ribosomal protein S18 acetylase RimI-like enzyme